VSINPALGKFKPRTQAAILVGLRVFLRIAKRFLSRYGTVVVSGASMAPTLNEGDWVVVRWKPRRKKLEAGNIVIVERDDQPGIQYVKRITKIEKKRYWVEGDNSEPSIDSRSWGFLTRKEIIGKYLFRYWKRR
jgi:nickel-type superoxide dismutase maturation protease